MIKNTPGDSVNIFLEKVFKLWQVMLTHGTALGVFFFFLLVLNTG